MVASKQERSMQYTHAQQSEEFRTKSFLRYDNEFSAHRALTAIDKSDKCIQRIAALHANKACACADSHEFHAEEFSGVTRVSSQRHRALCVHKAPTSEYKLDERDKSEKCTQRIGFASNESIRTRRARESFTRKEHPPLRRRAAIAHASA